MVLGREKESEDWEGRRPFLPALVLPRERAGRTRGDRRVEMKWMAVERGRVGREIGE
jgi:hypothetical protein